MRYEKCGSQRHSLAFFSLLLQMSVSTDRKSRHALKFAFFFFVLLHRILNKARKKRIYVCQAHSHPMRNSAWEMRNSFFINHTFRMLFHVLNIFNYFHIEHYIMKQISADGKVSTQNEISFFFIESFSSFMESLPCNFTNPN